MKEQQLRDSQVMRAASPFAAFGVGRRYAHRRGRAHEVLESFGDHLVGQILDVGAGSTGPTFVEALGRRYHALDLSRSYKSESQLDRDAIGHHIDLEEGRLPFDTGSYGTVMCLDVIEHVDDAHAIFRELFRVASDRVIVSLPNNWPHFIWSLLAGRNITHGAGYGIAGDPKPAGQRHKHFFNLEEAVDFLLGAAPDDFVCARLAFRCEYGSDGVLSTAPWLTRACRVGGKVTVGDARKRFGIAGVPMWALAKAAYLPLRAVDLLVTGMLYGWGSRLRYYNIGCRQVWAVFERRRSS
jgi:SAM-dependent methyltransferase